jgi:hypothetical protein
MIVNIAGPVYLTVRDTASRGAMDKIAVIVKKMLQESC